jgi:hypothetical protein
MNRALSSQANRTLRGQIEEYHAGGRIHSLKEAVGIIVPLAVELAERHAAGESLFVHPGSIAMNRDGDWYVSPVLGQRAPASAKDKACQAPEERAGRPGDARSSVFAIGAMLYELCTGESIGPGMRRPSEVVPTLPVELEMILAKALIGDPAHRPDDLKALAQAIHHLSPAGTLPPPPADESHLDHGEGFDVDLSLSLMPPVPASRGAAMPVAVPEMGSSPYEVAIREAPVRQSGVDQATEALTELKQRLESDPRPRYVVIKEGMDHGPFNAVELLQQIASNTFTESDLLRETFSKDERLIHDWPEFAPFAEHARRHRNIVAEKVAIQQTVEQEKKSTRGKAFLGLTAVGAVHVGGAVWFLAHHGTRKDDVAVQEETATNVDSEGNLNVGKKGGGKGGGRRVVGEQGGVPLLAGGMSCEAAQAAYVEEISIGGSKVPADITGSQYAAVLNGGSYLNGCGLSSSMGVDVCVAVQNGRAVGVTVRTSPHNGGVASCIAGHVRGMSFPAHPKLDVTRTHFAAQ